jgi:hypothetical protein
MEKLRKRFPPSPKVVEISETLGVGVGYLGLSKGTQLQKAKKLPSTLSK